MIKCTIVPGHGWYVSQAWKATKSIMRFYLAPIACSLLYQSLEVPRCSKSKLPCWVFFLHPPVSWSPICPNICFRTFPQHPHTYWCLLIPSAPHHLSVKMPITIFKCLSQCHFLQDNLLSRITSLLSAWSCSTSIASGFNYWGFCVQALLGFQIESSWKANVSSYSSSK